MSTWRPIPTARKVLDYSVLRLAVAIGGQGLALLAG